MATYYGWKYKLIELKHRLKELVLAYKIALKSKELGKPGTDTPVCIAIVDGTAVHGGMCDRFKGIVTLYAFCKHRNIPFRIKYTDPFRLENYLAPSDYDWRLKEHDLTDNPRYCRVLYMRKEYTAGRLLSLNTRKQVHFYGNRDCLEYINKAFDENYNWGQLFRELFKPGDALEERIRSAKEGIGDNYYAAVFRFQNLLGDFKEYSFRPLESDKEKELLVKKCLSAIKSLKEENGNIPLLVTSDSMTFLERASSIGGVHIIPGRLVHIDNRKDGTSTDKPDVYMKSFVDFYMLSGARKIYRIGTSYMYNSEFPVYAAKVNDIPFYSITI